MPDDIKAKALELVPEAVVLTPEDVATAMHKAKISHQECRKLFNQNGSLKIALGPADKAGFPSKRARVE